MDTVKFITGAIVGTTKFVIKTTGSFIFYSTSFATVVGITAIITKPSNQSLDTQIMDDLKNQTTSNNPIINRIISNISNNAENNKIRDMIVFKTAECNFENNKWFYVGAFGSWYRLEQN